MRCELPLVHKVLVLSLFCLYSCTTTNYYFIIAALFVVSVLSFLAVTGIKVEAGVSLGECTLGMAGVPQGSVRGRLLFPEICLMELQLLASGSPDLEVLGHVLQSLLGAVKGHHSNAALLYQQVRLLSDAKLIYLCMRDIDVTQ